MSKEIGSYPKIYNLGHKAIRDIFKEPTLAQEKIDGSQISFMKKDEVTYVRSKGAMLYFDNPEKMFSLGMDSIAAIAHDLVPGWIYRGEYLQKPKHNVLKYDNIPEGHIILYDIQVGDQEFLGPVNLGGAADYLGLETVPYWDMPANITQEDVGQMMLQISCLGGTPVEGIVFKNYQRFDQYTGKVMMGKHVSEAFKEVHQGKKYGEKSGKDRIQSLVEEYRTVPRWQKAVQAIKEAGGLTDSPTDIGQLIKYVTHDVLTECEDEIKEKLFKWAWKQLSRGITSGLPEWYKDKLMEKQFEEVSADSKGLATNEGGFKIVLPIYYSCTACESNTCKCEKEES